MKPITGAVQAVPPLPDANQAPKANDPQQLALRLFAWVDACATQPPERALWRVVLDLALRNAPRSTFVVYGRPMSPAIVHHTALVIHTLTNQAGIAHVTDIEIAQQARREEKIITKSILVLNRVWVLRTIRDNRRGARFHQLNLGGLDWSAIRHRARLHRRRKKASPTALPLPLTVAASGVHGTPLSGVHGTPLLRYVRTGRISESIAAAGTSRASSTDRQHEQQQLDRDQIRIEGLFGCHRVSLPRAGVRLR